MSVAEAVEKTIRMAEKYGVGLTADEVEKRLLSGKVYGRGEIENQLRIRNYKLGIKNKKNKKLEKAKRLARKYLVGFRDIAMVGVTGSVAAGSASRESDIDLMIVTRKNRLWLTRLRLKWWGWKWKIPQRRYGQEERKDEFCFNLWLDEKNLKLPVGRRTERSALDLMMMKPILDRNDCYKRLVMTNGWVKKYVATGYEKLIANYELRITNDRENSNILVDVLNYLAFVGQYVYMKPKMGGETVGLTAAFFHRVV